MLNIFTKSFKRYFFIIIINNLYFRNIIIINLKFLLKLEIKSITLVFSIVYPISN